MMINEPFIHDHHPQLLRMNNWEKNDKQLVAGFTTRKGGVSQAECASFNLGLHVNDEHPHVVRNRRLLAHLVNFPTETWICAEQIHDNRIVKVTAEQLGAGVFNFNEGILQTDGLYTNEVNILLSLVYADCVPLYFYAKNHNLIGVAHAGWKGTIKDIAGEMVRKWVKDEGVCVDEILITIGPSIGSCCYVVDDFVINAVKNVLPDHSNHLYTQVTTGQYSLDLKQINKLLLIKAGIPAGNITTSSYCTSCEKELFFSHRRDKGKTGRMLSFIGLKED